MKIAHLTSAHSRYDIRIFKKECISLANNGYDTSLIVADGLGNENTDNVNILDIGKPKNRIKRIFHSTSQIFKMVIIEQYDVCHIHDPELLLIVHKLKSNGIKVIYDIHEDLPQQIMLKTWIPSFLRSVTSKSFKLFEEFISKKIDALVVPQPYMEKKYSIINSKTYLVENFVILNGEIKSDLPKSGDEKICFHAGRLTKDRGLLNMINSFKNSNNNCKLILAGNFNDDAVESLNDLDQFENITYLGIIPYEKTVEYYLKSDFGVILYNNVGQYYLSYAIKLFEYMSYGLPVIMPNFGEWVQFNEENKCGLNVDTSNPVEVKKMIEKLVENKEYARELGQNGFNAVQNKYNWGIAEKKLLNLYRELN